MPVIGALASAGFWNRRLSQSTDIGTHLANCGSPPSGQTCASETDNPCTPLGNICSSHGTPAAISAEPNLMLSSTGTALSRTVCAKKVCGVAADTIVCRLSFR